MSIGYLGLTIYQQLGQLPFISVN